MSMFNRASMPCPVCGTPKAFDLVASVNADRRPDLRAKIMDGSFQREKCDSCGSTFRTPPLMTYLDMARNQWILVQPGGDVRQWKALQEKARSVFAVAYGPDASPEAQDMGREIKARVVFGWGALSEKLLCSEHGVDDVNLELLKMAVLREVPDPPLNDQNDLRLVAVEGDELVLAWLGAEDEHVSKTLRVPRELYDEIAADNDAWKPLREELSADPFVDFNRLIVADADEGAEEDTGTSPLAAANDETNDTAEDDEEVEEEEKPGKKPAGKKSKSTAKPKKNAPSAKSAPAKKKKKK
jgi:hypothetical protein